jgi:NADPH2:quinone reductase
MKAAYIEQTGPPENIIFGDLPTPEPSASEVLVKVHAVAVNPIDTYLRAGSVKMDLPMPFIVGCDLAGVVEDVGRDVTRFAVGDRVWGSNQGLLGRQGTFAEYAAVESCWLHHTPEEIDDNQAAAVALVGITAHLGTFREAGLKTGETLLINGGTGGVGSCVIQMAKAVGARVIATAGSKEKVSACRELGADLAIDYTMDDTDATIQRFAPNGIDVWWETQQEHDLKRAIGHLAVGGRLILIAGRDSCPPFPVGPFYVKDCKACGFVMFNAPSNEQRKSAAEINRWLARGRLRPRIDRIMPLSEAAAAHQLQEDNTLQRAGTLSGKIVLKP